MEYEIVIEKGREETVIKYLKALRFVTVRKKTTAEKKPVKHKKPGYFGMMTNWETDAADLRKNNFRKTNKGW